ncbi:DUF3102 domain-containing protein [Heliophilum fasciatum]|uniref:DUF3102 family protein n=1 Tax=Heliophilum fasciatum TaxID=35700 RepID=A0A4R2S091_9FIRM|nr:DUF3102 domain-containing protein [Heliophilum fasciatum]MCW2277750.1 chromosome segregation ATPase [Heliophilum fasciatum]TCP64755.1 DUF3102 family protein [Heliophilum fasciatum]
MSELARTPELIAAEINLIKHETRRTILVNSVEIGKRLHEVKSLVPHGEWGKWLESNVDYSQSTANNLMRISEEYAPMLTRSNSQALENLSYTQAVALLALPSEEREQFVTENNVKGKSTRELNKLLKEKQQLEQMLEQAQKELESERSALKTVSESYDRLEKANTKHYEEAKKLKEQLKEAKKSGNSDEVDRLQREIAAKNQELQSTTARIKSLEQELMEKPLEVSAVVEKVPEAVEKELQELRQGAAVTKYKLQFEGLVSGFKGLLGALAEIKETDPASHERYKNAVAGLINKMSQAL